MRYPPSTGIWARASQIRSITRLSVIQISGLRRNSAKASAIHLHPRPNATRRSGTSDLQPARVPGRGCVVQQDAPEALGIVLVSELAGAREMVIVQARHPEPQRARTQHHWPGFALA